MLGVNLDDKYDILMIMLSDNSNSYADESRNGIEIFRSFDTEEITAIMIYDFCKRYQENTLNQANFPVELDFNNIYNKVSH